VTEARRTAQKTIDQTFINNASVANSRKGPCIVEPDTERRRSVSADLLARRWAEVNWPGSCIPPADPHYVGLCQVRGRKTAWFRTPTNHPMTPPSPQYRDASDRRCPRRSARIRASCTMEGLFDAATSALVRSVSVSLAHPPSEELSAEQARPADLKHRKDRKFSASTPALQPAAERLQTGRRLQKGMETVQAISPAPQCPLGGADSHLMVASTGISPEYFQFSCDGCANESAGLRWHCSRCYIDYCFGCRPHHRKVVAERGSPRASPRDQPLRRNGEETPINRARDDFQRIMAEDGLGMESHQTHPREQAPRQVENKLFAVSGNHVTGSDRARASIWKILHGEEMHDVASVTVLQEEASGADGDCELDGVFELLNLRIGALEDVLETSMRVIHQRLHEREIEIGRHENDVRDLINKSNCYQFELQSANQSLEAERTARRHEHPSPDTNSNIVADLKAEVSAAAKVCARAEAELAEERERMSSIIRQAEDRHHSLQDQNKRYQEAIENATAQAQRFELELLRAKVTTTRILSGLNDLAR